jgi:hypothetical protein
MRVLACFAVEWPEARAECAIGETSLVADSAWMKEFGA